MTVSSSFQNSPLEAAKQRIQQAIKQGLTEVSLADLGLTDLPAGLCELLAQVPGLRSLDLAGNAIAQLPEGIAELTSLHVLSLKGNPLTTLPESLGQLTELRVLDISETGVGVLPRGLQRLVEARSLMVIQDVEETTRGYDIFTPVLRGPSGGRTPKGLGFEDTETEYDIDQSGLPSDLGIKETPVEHEVTRGYETISSGQDTAMASAIKEQIRELPSVTADEQTAGEQTQKVADWINASVFCPRQVKRDNPFLVQVFAYLPEQIEAVIETAQMLDETTEQVAKKKLGVKVQRKTDLTFELSMPGVLVDNPVQSFTWQGWESSVEFGVRVPEDFVVSTSGKRVIGTVTVSQKSVPIGHLKFVVTVVPDGAVLNGEPELVGEDATSYKKVFVSYSSKDRAEVLKRVQGLLSLDIEVFQDVLNLKPGDRWEQKLYLKIDECDLFLLFWSQAAKASQWVLKEAQYALALQDEDDLRLPAIKPVILEGPPIVPPPEELQNLHFNDVLTYLINQSELKR